MTDKYLGPRKKERIDYALWHKHIKKKLKEESVSEDAFQSVSSVIDDVFRSVSSEFDLSSDRDTAAETSSNASIDYSTVDDPFSTQLSNLSHQLEGIEVADTTMADGTRLRNLAEAISEDIDDHIDENQFSESSAIVDIDTSITKIEELRTKYRSAHKDLKSLDGAAYETELKTDYDKVIQCIKAYLANIKQVKTSIHKNETSENTKLISEHQEDVRGDRQHKKDTSEFLIADVDRIMDLLLDETAMFSSSSSSEVTDEEIWEVKKNLPMIQKQLESMSEKYKELLEIIPDSVPDKDHKLGKLSDKHRKLLKAERDFRSKLDNEIKARELTKEKSFETSTLIINLPKFSGYDSSIDVYTFQEKFEKLHKSKTPKRLMPELLKNNYLEGSALEFVKRHEDIDEIWRSLKIAFGDPRMMKKVHELEAVPPLWRVKDSEKAKDSLSKVVNLIDELMKLASVHNVEDNLYYGDAIYSIYKVIGDTRVSKFLEDTYEANLKGVDLWKELVKYLEKEIKINTEKAMIHRNLEQKSQKDHDKDRDKKDPKGVKAYQAINGSSNNSSGGGGVQPGDSNLKTNKRDQTHCSLCGKDDHVSTKGPYGMIEIDTIFLL